MAHVSNAWIRWTAPVGVVAVVAAGSLLLSNRADAKPADLPPRTTQELLADVIKAGQNTAAGGGPVGLSGTVVQTADLGLPEVQGLLNSSKGSGELSAIVAGSHTWKVWYSGPEKVRLALLGSGSESDVIRNGRDVWIWSSNNKTATHHLLPEDAGTPATPDSATSALSADPGELARQLLAGVGPSTTVTGPATVSVAGRSAYELSLSPKASGSLIKDIKIAVDAEFKVPLRVQIDSVRKSGPAIEVGFTDVDFTKPEDRQFQFTPPPGTEVTEGDKAAGNTSEGDSSTSSTSPAPSASTSAPTSGSTSGSSDDKGTDRKAGQKADEKSDSGRTYSGSDWTTVVVQKQDTSADDRSGSQGDNQLMDQLMSVGQQVSGSWGSGRIFRGTVFTVLITDDGRTAFGAVQPELLYQALAAK